MVLAFFLALSIPATGTFHLPSGTTEVSSELHLPSGAHDLTIIGGDHTILKATADFHGRALLSCNACSHITFREFAIDGNRAALEKPLPMPTPDHPFAEVFPNNGILIENSQSIEIDHVDLSNVANLAILINHSRDLRLTHISVSDSGSRNAKGRNNSTGGILLEQGSDSFTVAGSVFHNILGNAIWTHSYQSAPRNIGGKIVNNKFFDIGRDAIQVGHAQNVLVQGNSGVRIGFPVDAVDVETLGIPVGIDTAGNVGQSTYEDNQFEEINGKCIDLDGFHDGTVRGNTCVNHGRPEDYPYGNFGIAMNNANPSMQSRNIIIENNRLEGMKFGGIFALGVGHTIRNNRMLHLNMAHCNETHAKFGCIAIADEPGFLRSGIYLARRGEHPAPASGIVIENNVISGYKMVEHCIEAAPSVKLTGNVIRNNRCLDE